MCGRDPAYEAAVEKERRERADREFSESLAAPAEPRMTDTELLNELFAFMDNFKNIGVGFLGSFYMHSANFQVNACNPRDLWEKAVRNWRGWQGPSATPAEPYEADTELLEEMFAFMDNFRAFGLSHSSSFYLASGNFNVSAASPRELWEKGVKQWRRHWKSVGIIPIRVNGGFHNSHEPTITGAWIKHSAELKLDPTRWPSRKCTLYLEVGKAGPHKRIEDADIVRLTSNGDGSPNMRFFTTVDEFSTQIPKSTYTPTKQKSKAMRLFRSVLDMFGIK